MQAKRLAVFLNIVASVFTDLGITTCGGWHIRRGVSWWTGTNLRYDRYDVGKSNRCTKGKWKHGVGVGDWFQEAKLGQHNCNEQVEEMAGREGVDGVENLPRSLCARQCHFRDGDGEWVDEAQTQEGWRSNGPWWSHCKHCGQEWLYYWRERMLSDNGRSKNYYTAMGSANKQTFMPVHTHMAKLT